MEKNARITCFQDTLRFSLEGSLKAKTREACKSNKVYKEGFSARKSPEGFKAEIRVIEGGYLCYSKRLARGNQRVCVLNFANPHKPGGVVNGAVAQEECLCGSSNLYLCLADENVEQNYYGTLQRYFFTDRLIYTRDITEFKSDDTVPQHIYIIREQIQGETLEEIVRKNGVQPQRMLDWFEQLCKVLIYLHNLQLAHIFGDINLANITLQPAGRLRLIRLKTMQSYGRENNLR